VWNTVKEPVYGDLDAIEDTSQRRLLKATDRLAAAIDEAPVFIFAMLDRSKLGVMVTPDLQTLLEPSSAYGAVWAAIENMLLAARALEIGAISTNLTRLMDAEVRGILEYPEHVETVSMLALGRPRPPARFGPTTRRPVSDVAHGERWGVSF
jgi:nitroreductase